MKKEKLPPPEQDDFRSNVFGAAEPTELILCKQDQKNTVVWQNLRCVELCGNRVGTVCSNGCKAILEPMRARALQVKKNVIVRGERVDLAALRLREKSYVAMESHSAFYKEEFALIKPYSLTSAEERIMRMKIAGFSVPEIARSLFVAQATIKTHLLHAYQKLPEKLVARFQSSKKRF